MDIIDNNTHNLTNFANKKSLFNQNIEFKKTFSRFDVEVNLPNKKTINTSGRINKIFKKI